MQTISGPTGMELHDLQIKSISYQFFKGQFSQLGWLGL